MKKSAKSAKYALAALASCREARRQQTMGRALDPKRPVARCVPILEELFNDSDLLTKPASEVVRPKHGPVAADTPFARRPEEIRGVGANEVRRLFEEQQLRACRSVHQFGNLAAVYFFPPTHELCLTRKSRPALIGVRSGGVDFNGAENAETAAARAGHKKQRSRSTNPLEYAVWRQESVRVFRRALFNAFDPSADGAYLVMIKRVPTQDEADAIMRKVVKAAAAAAAARLHTSHS